jgi:hypothetical protein
MNIPKFKIRCSAISKIMTDDVKTKPLTENQKNRLAELLKKEKLTDNMHKEMNKLIEKEKAKPELSAGAKSYCQQWLKEQIYGRRAEVKSKYLEKGNICEDYAIEMLNYILKKQYAKNEEYFENEYMTGTPDIICDIIRDIKNSWSVDSYPLFDLKVKNDYYWQMQGYMNLTDLKKASVDFCLVNAPDHLIQSEVKRASYTSPKTDYELSQYYTHLLTFDDINPRQRVRSFPVDYNQNDIDKIQQRVEMCRVYIQDLINRMEK